VIVRFVDIGGVDDHHCLIIFVFNNFDHKASDRVEGYKSQICFFLMDNIYRICIKSTWNTDWQSCFFKGSPM